MDAETINKKDRNGRTLLHRSLYQNKNETVVRLLTTPGINVNVKTDIGDGTALHYACEKNNVEAIKMLLASPGIEINSRSTRSKYGHTPIMTALYFCNREALQVMVDDHRVNLDEALKSDSIGSGTTAQKNECLELIIKSRKLREKEENNLSKLLKNVSDTKALNVKDENGRNLLHRSLHQNNTKAVISLLSTEGIDVNAKTNYGCTPLIYACGKNNIQAVKLLLLAPTIEVNHKDTYGRTAIMVALGYRSRDAVKLLLDDYRVDLDEGMKSNDGRNLEDWISGSSAERLRYLEMIKKARNGRSKEKQTLLTLLKATDANSLNARDEHGRNLLHRSLHHNNTKVVNSLLNAPGIDVNVLTTNTCGTPLMYAIEINNSEAVKTILESPGILVNITDKYGRTPLMHALAWCSRESLKLLVKDLRVDLDERIKSSSGRKQDDYAGFYAEERGYGQHGDRVKQECLKILYEARKIRKSVSELQKKMVDIKIYKTKNEVAIHKSLECPVCLENMKPPTRIWMCSLSHIVCEPCKYKLEDSVCPKCRTESVTLRAYMAEDFANAVFN